MRGEMSRLTSTPSVANSPASSSARAVLPRSTQGTMATMKGASRRMPRWLKERHMPMTATASTMAYTVVFTGL